ncbi:MAG: cation diffusion facilitator family transporter [Acidimicrobiales bacterium]
MSAGGEQSTRAVMAALLANLGIAVAKLIGFLITRSSSMLAEAIHSVADTGNQALLLFGDRRARHPADSQHQFGYGRERYFWSFVVALVLFALGSAFAVAEGVDKILHPHELDNVPVALGILVLAMVLEGLSFRTAIGEARPRKGHQSWWQFIRTSRIPELPVVILEDFGALCGLGIAFVAVGLSTVTGDPLWDGIGTLAIGILLGVIAVVLVIEMRSLLIGEGAHPDDMEKIRAAVIGAPGVRELLHLRTEHIGPQELLVGAKVMFDPHLGVEGLARAVDGVEAAVRAEVPYAHPIYVEPDLQRATVDERS